MKLVLTIMSDDGRRALINADVLVPNDLLTRRDPRNDQRQDDVGRLVLSKVTGMIQALQLREERKRDATDGRHPDRGAGHRPRS